MLKRKPIYPELNALKGLIREKKSSYRVLSEKAGCSPNTLYLMLNGYYPPNGEYIEKIATELDINPNDIVKYFFPRMLRNAI
jgi:lambda repressor-like predicted transcriptional regulator